MEKENLNTASCQTDVIGSCIGTLCFVNNEPYVIHNNEKYKVWNLNNVSIHTYGYPQMNASIGNVYTAYKAGTKFEFSLFRNNEAYLYERVWD